MQNIVALLFFILSSPIFIILFFIVKLTSAGPFIFRQKRIGKNHQSFTIYKIRTMVKGAEHMKENIKHLNEVNSPVFKIHNDPRFTPIGRFLAHTGLNELPQLVNILKGEMAFVGPRPLPEDETKKIPGKYSKRFSILPGLTSLWVIRGSHKLSFEKWMESDLEYVRNRNLFLDLKILLKTLLLCLSWVILESF